MRFSIGREIARALGLEPRISVAASFALAYLAFAWIAGRSYPMNRMRMFAPPDTTASHVVARTEDGALREVRFFARWRCDGKIDFSTNEAGIRRGYDELVQNHLLRNVGEPEHGIPVELVRRTFSIPVAHGPLVIDDKVLLRCRADLRDAPIPW